MAEPTGSNVVRRASPYGQVVTVEKLQHEYTHPDTNADILARWRAMCERHTAVILSIPDIPIDHVRLVLEAFT